MNAVKIAAVALLVLGVLGLSYGAFSTARETHRAHLGALELTLKDKETVRIPIWASVAAMVAGSILLIPRRTRQT